MRDAHWPHLFLQINWLTKQKESQVIIGRPKPGTEAQVWYELAHCHSGDMLMSPNQLHLTWLPAKERRQHIFYTTQTISSVVLNWGLYHGYPTVCTQPAITAAAQDYYSIRGKKTNQFQASTLLTSTRSSLLLSGSTSCSG